MPEAIEILERHQARVTHRGDSSTRDQSERAVPRKRRDSKRRPLTGLPIAALHFLASGDDLTQEAGETAFGPTYAWIDVFDIHPTDYAAVWAEHRDAIEAHARRIGRRQTWVQEVLENAGLVTAAAAGPGVGKARR
jgi:hypothetical protein